MKRFILSTAVLFVSICFTVQSFAADGDLFIQVELNTDPQGCSILKVTPQGQLIEFISNNQIIDVIGSNNPDCDDTGLAVGLDGKVYFSEDRQDDILVATPEGDLSIFIKDTVVDSIVPNNVEWDNGLAINPADGNLFAADESGNIIFEFPTNVPTPITNTDLINIVLEEEDFEEFVTTVDLEGGIALDFRGNLYITNDDSSNDVDTVIFKYDRNGDLSILCSQDELAAATGSNQIDLDVGAVFGGKLYVADDGTCDCILEIDTNSCDPKVIVTEQAITAVTGNPVDMEGGLCIDAQRNLYIGEDGDDEPNIVFSPFDFRNNTSLYVSEFQINSIYNALYPSSDPQLRGSCSVEGGLDTAVRPIPTLSEWGLIAMAGIIGLAGFIAIRRKSITA